MQMRILVMPVEMTMMFAVVVSAAAAAGADHHHHRHHYHYHYQMCVADSSLYPSSSCVICLMICFSSSCLNLCLAFPFCCHYGCETIRLLPNLNRLLQTLLAA
jgi:hypothetical protein